MTRVGIIGVGFMGMVHYLSYQKISGVQVVALCDQDTKRLTGDWRGIQGNFGPPGEQMDLSGIATYSSSDELMADADVDLIDITLPPSAHAAVAEQALSAGKHVFCEKPMAMNSVDCDRMVTVANDTGRHLMVGHVLPFVPEYAWALRTIRSGEYGKLLGGSFKRVISDPAWLNNFWSAEQVGGPMLDLHVHDAHFIRLAFGMPTSVITRGSTREGLPEHWHSLFQFGDSGVTAHATSGTISQQGRPFLHGFEIHLERATLVFEFAVLGDKAEYLCEPTILNSDGEVERVDVGDGDPMIAFQEEMAHVLQVVQGEVPAGILDATLARDAITLCHKQTESLASGESVSV